MMNNLSKNWKLILRQYIHEIIEIVLSLILILFYWFVRKDFELFGNQLDLMIDLVVTAAWISYILKQVKIIFLAIDNKSKNKEMKG